jgi:hypothetical protein
MIRIAIATESAGLSLTLRRLSSNAFAVEAEPDRNCFHHIGLALTDAVEKVENTVTAKISQRSARSELWQEKP